jgi:serine protease Do
MTNDHYRAVPTSVFAVLAVVFIALTSPVAVGAQAPTVLQQLDEAFVQVADKVTPAVVNISSSKKEPSGPTSDMDPFFKNHPFREFFGDDFFKRFRKGPGPGKEGKEGKGFRQQGMGSGVIVTADGYIVTNSHVVKDADEINVNLSDKRSYKAKVVGADPESDIAVIKIDAKDLPIATLGDSSKLRVGEIVLAVGNPFGLNRTVTSGIVSATGRTNMGIIDYEDFIQTDAAINPGNSGGPLVNIRAEVIGINTAIASRSGGYQGIGFAIPSSSAKLIVDELIKDGKVRRGLLGVNIQDLNESLAKSFGISSTEGALVSQVVPDSPAEKAGIKAGDIITKFNGEPVTGASHLKNMVGREKPGTATTLTVVRDKKPFDVKVNVTERTQKMVAAAKSSTGEGEKVNELGLELEKIPAAVAEKLGLKEGQGLRVKDIDEDGLGARMGLRGDDIILEVDGSAISDVAELNNAVSKAQKNKVIRLTVQRGSARIFLAHPLG